MMSCASCRRSRALQCKEVWGEGAYALRNPSQALPANWAQEDPRVADYRLLQHPVEAPSCLQPLHERRTAALTPCHRDLPRNPWVHLDQPAAHEDRRLFRGVRLTAQPEPPTRGRRPDLVQQRDGRLDLLDILAAADRLIEFMRVFTQSGTNAVRSREAWRPRLVRDLCAEGTNTGITRVAIANQRESFTDLL
jgi:hypothetical protein